MTAAMDRPDEAAVALEGDESAFVGLGERHRRLSAWLYRIAQDPPTVP